MKKYIFSLIAMAFGMMNAFAQTVSVADVTIKAGETKVVSINLNNTQTNIVSFQMDLTLPDGITINKAGCSLGNRIADYDQQLTIGKQPDGSIRLTSTSFALRPITGTSGEVVKLSLTAASNAKGGTASLKNILFATSNSESLTADNTTFKVTVTYALTYILDGEVYRSENMAYGTALTPETAPTKEGHTFSGWNGLPATMPAHDVTVTGSFTVNNYTITYMVDGVVYMTSTVAYGTELVPEPALQKEGYTFTGWSEIPKTMPAHDVVVTGAFYIYGDVNTDDEVDLLDVVDIARFVVGTPAETFMVNLADLNYDKTVNVTDAVVLVNVVAGDQNFVKEMKTNTTSGYYDYASCGLELLCGRDNTLSFCLNGETDFTAFQFVVDVPEGTDITDLRLNGARKDGHQLLYNKVEDGTYCVVVLSLTNSTFKGSEGELLSISFDSLTSDEICIHDIHFVTTNGTEVAFDDLYLSGTTTRIEDLMSGNSCDDKVYDLQGRRQPALRRGVNIVGGKKIMVK